MIRKGVRWGVIGLIAVATVINYIDRNALAVMWPAVSADIGATKEDYALLVTVFMIAYAAGQALFGRVFDRIGVRMGFVVSIVIWSASIAAHALVRGLGLLALLRVTLGVSEAGNWPGAAKSNAIWFPPQERAFAQGMFNAGASLGGIVSAPLVALLFVSFGWQATFVIIGLLGFVWLIPWLWYYKADPDTHPWVSDEERALIATGRDAKAPPEPAPPLGELLSKRQSWAVISGRFFLDPVWWLFVSWLPIYLAETFGFNVAEIGMFAWVPFVGAMLGSLFGGWLSGRLIASGRSIDRARKWVITLGCLIMAPALLGAVLAHDPTVAVLTIAAVLFGFQVAIGNIQTLPGDVFHGKSVGSLAGVGGMAAVAGTLITTWLVPVMTKVSYAPMFILVAALVPLSLVAIWVVTGRIEKVDVSSTRG